MATNEQLAELGRLIKQLRVERGLTMRELAKQVSVELAKPSDREVKELSHTYISRIESGGRQRGRDVAFTPGDDLLHAIAAALGVDISLFSKALGRMGDMEYIADPDTREVIEAFVGLPDDMKRMLGASVISAAEEARKIERERAIGKRAE